MLYVLMALAAAYLLGSIPFPVVVNRAVSGVDLRDHGSGNMGAMNAALPLSAVNWPRARPWWEEWRK